MANLQSELERLAKNPSAAALLHNKPFLQTILNGPDAKRLMTFLEQNSGNNLKAAAESAIKGDTSALQNLAKQVMASKEGSQLIRQISEKLPQSKSE